eukprot:TRINITY_DN6823_c0_g1_i3.p3 TRINITY_DN6823_c0_g1~~TRINITY_DN6823_c0_g1_i3.p3  ORF type:complete len:106 (+),score=14.76 TRINITY_DN6823_c0_g1_i3:96-413(+)
MSSRAHALGLISGLTALQKSWKPAAREAFLTKAQIETYKQHGFLVLTDFYTPDECQAMKNEMQALTAQYDPSKDEAAVFETGEQQVTKVCMACNLNIRRYQGLFS